MYYLKKYIFGKGFHFAWSYGKKLQPPAYALPSLNGSKDCWHFPSNVWKCITVGFWPGPGASYRIALWSAGNMVCP